VGQRANRRAGLVVTAKNSCLALAPWSLCCRNEPCRRASQSVHHPFMHVAVYPLLVPVSFIIGTCCPSLTSRLLEVVCAPSRPQSHPARLPSSSLFISFIRTSFHRAMLSSIRPRIVAGIRVSELSNSPRYPSLAPSSLWKV
jgi:hypothetical protein